ncbi:MULTISPECIES: phosphoglycerate kinase [Methanothrix]|uniref:phosphoglycerate kinase n=2 Tax=Methanotrichaceae TaxID=143067 RepID=UPI001E761100|nr:MULTISPECIES: phosphoglycerate kinase [Methanothrix]MDD3551007.1 phosphoglycerate kinase [Methanothrix soehngenii]UEC40621.1 MAG: Phosphoglycerate kinase 1 [Methanothrix sp.]HOI20598.1 phosphoglycerate kinase [Methanothrix soehngenii]HPE50074.1 phosphoglycerate kinase [Methanothrix soehngenii]HRW31504.1 phosphoglycerate kinase [Methanothrix sp.]
MKDYLTMEDVKLDNKRVLVRVDFNSPMDPSGNILDDKRIKSHLDTLRALEDCRVVLMAHQSRAGKKDYTTMEAHARSATRLLRRDVAYIDDIFGSHAREAIRSLMPGEVLLLENTRFYAEENMNRTPADHAKSHMVKRLAPLFDLFINDAFAVSHRSHCSVVGFTEVLPSIAGLLMDKEITALDKGLKGDEHPTIYSLGGTKADDSIKVIENVLRRGGADKILTSGVVATVFLMAAGINVGEANRKFVEDQEYLEQIPVASKLLAEYPDKIAMPVDVALNKNGERIDVAVSALSNDLPIADIGLETIVDYSKELKDARVTVMNGPAGIFEQEKFKLGTSELLKASAESDYSIAGGGHSVAAIEQLGLESKFSHVSMGGGASITYLSGEPLPGIEALKKYALKVRKA